MEKNKKITLFPTRYIKKISAEATGTGQISEKNTLSLNLYNLPSPNLFSRENYQCNSYKSWLYNPGTQKAILMGTLTSSSEGLYTLYDIPLEIQDGFNELIITAEEDDVQVPEGEILLIGYLAQSLTQPLEKFEPFSKPLLFHSWWKIEENTGTKYGENKCQFCPYWQRYCWPHEPTNEQPDLPEIIGILKDQENNIKYLVHGIPGRFSKNSQPDRGRTGYLYWHPYYGIKEKPGALGYWLCYLDPITNKVVTPMGVTIP